MTAILQRGYVQSTSRNVANLYPMLARLPLLGHKKGDGMRICWVFGLSEAKGRHYIGWDFSGIWAR